MKHFFILIFILFVLIFFGLFIYGHRDSGISNIFPKPVQDVKEAPTAPHVTTPVGDTVEQKKTVVLRLNQKATFNGVTIVPTKLIEESRCPSDVQCIQAGRVIVLVNEVQAEIGKPFVVGNVRVTMTKATPYPVSTKQIGDTEYQFNFILELVR